MRANRPLIGGEHWLAVPQRVPRSLGDALRGALGPLAWYASGRDALYALLVSRPEPRLHLPELVCPSIVQAAQAAGKALHFYRVGAALSAEGPLPAPGPGGDLLLAIHFFGRVDLALLDRTRAAGLAPVSDVTHLLLQPAALAGLRARGEPLVASLRKTGPFPDGGFVAAAAGLPAPGPLRAGFVGLRSAGLASRGFAARSGFADGESLALLQQAEAALDAEAPAARACSTLSRALLDTEALAPRRRRTRANQAALHRALEAATGPGAPARPTAGADAAPHVPLLFADRGRRDAVRRHLAAHAVFCPVHWDTSALPRPSPLSERLLSVPCDARYRPDDLRRVARLIAACA